MNNALAERHAQAVDGFSACRTAVTTTTTALFSPICIFRRAEEGKRDLFYPAEGFRSREAKEG